MSSSTSSTLEFPQVTAHALANVYFDGKVVSHAIILADGSRKTLGLIYPGTYRFDTSVAERMEITAGRCLVRLDGQSDFVTYEAGSAFEIPAKSAFDIQVSEGIAQYVCSYL
jgi:uncharacterized protein YaiE (UPF0345 family)